MLYFNDLYCDGDLNDQTTQYLIESCTSSSSFSALVEGSPNNFFQPKRGIWQGDPLSPLMFILILDLLDRRKLEAFNEGKWELFSFNGVEVEFHLSYVNDVIFFCRATKQYFEVLNDILGEFTTLARQEINKAKSFIICSVSVTDPDELSRVLEFPLKQLPFNHLGTPIIRRVILHLDCDRLISSLQGVLTHWVGRCLSYTRHF